MFLLEGGCVVVGVSGVVGDFVSVGGIDLFV